MENYLNLLRKDGYVLVPNAIDLKLVDQLKTRIIELEQSLPPVPMDTIPYLNQGHKVVYSLENKDPLFVRAMFNHPIARAIKIGMLNDEWYKQIPQGKPNYILRAMLARSGGSHALPLHIDSFIPSSGHYAWAIQVGFILEDQTVENGCTVFVPGSHRFDRYATQDAMKDAVPVTPKKGDLVIWDSRVWHGALGNQTTGTRWAFIGTFTRWWVKQNYDTVRNIPKALFDQFTDEEKSILGFCSSPPFNEYDRIDIKAGYDLLKKFKVE